MKVRIYQCYSTNKFPFNIFALGIKFFSKTNYSHYALSYESETGNTIYCDSTSMGVRQTSEDKFLKKYELKKAWQCKKEIPRKYFLRWFEKHQGKSYGFLQIIGLLGKILNIFKHSPFGKGSKRIICNELVILFLNRFYAAGIDDTDSLDLNDTEKLITKVQI